MTKSKLNRKELEKLNSEVKNLKKIIDIDDPIEKKVKALDGILEIHKNYSYHSYDQRVSEIGAAIAKKFGLDKEYIERIRQAALLHDVGKIVVSRDIMEKIGPLKARERKERKRHTIYGDYILKGVGLEGLAIGAKSHHERVDGKGYPHGLQEDDLELTTRIIAMADTYDAMKSNRYYRSVEMSDEIIVEELRRVAGLPFDKELLRNYIQQKLERLGGDKEKLRQKIVYYNRFLKHPLYTMDILQYKGVNELEDIYMKQRLNPERQLDDKVVEKFLELEREEKGEERLQKIREKYPDKK